MRSRDSDIEIAQKISNGDKLAMKELYETYAAPLQNFVKNWLGDPTQASDLVHETMMEVWRNAGRFEGKSSLKSWIFSIARNKSIDANRKGARMSYTDETPEIADEQMNAEDVMQAAQDSAGLREAIHALSDAHKRVLHLAYFQDMRYEDIAIVENCPVGTVKTRMMHAKKKLLHILQKDSHLRKKIERSS